MRKLLFGFAVIALIGACKKETVAEKLEITGAEEFKEPAFSNLKPEEQKKAMNTSGVEFMNSLDALANEKAIEVIANMDNLSMNLGSNGLNTLVFKSLKAVATLKNNGNNLSVVYKSYNELVSETPQTLQDVFKEMAGIYNWNGEEMEKSTAVVTDKIQFNFPTKGKTGANNASLTISNFKTQSITNTVEGLSELPTSIFVELKVDGSAAASFTYTASFKTTGNPIDLKAEIKVGSFAMSAGYTNKDDKSISANYLFTAGTKTLMAMGATVNGNFTIDAINSVDSTYTVERKYFNLDYKYDPITKKYKTDTIWKSYTYEESKFLPEKVLADANAYYQIMDMKLVGKIDFKTLMTEGRALEAKKLSDDANAEELVKIVNKNVTLIVVNAKDNSKFANVEVYVETKEVYDQKWVNGNWVTSSTPRYVKEPNLQMVFGDKTKQDVETFFAGFDDLEKEMTDFETKMSEKLD